MPASPVVVQEVDRRMALSDRRDLEMLPPEQFQGPKRDCQIW